MNQIQAKDWAEESWHSHTGIDSSCDYCLVGEPAGKAEESVGKSAEKTAGTKKVHDRTQANIFRSGHLPFLIRQDHCIHN